MPRSCVGRWAVFATLRGFDRIARFAGVCELAMTGAATIVLFLVARRLPAEAGGVGDHLHDRVRQVAAQERDQRVDLPGTLRGASIPIEAAMLLAASFGLKVT